MVQRGLRVIESDKTFFKKITNTINKILIPTRVGFNGLIINMKRNNLLKFYENNEKENKNEQTLKRYEEAYTLYLESIDKYIMDSVYKKVKNNTATDFEKEALAKYYEVTHLKENEYIEYKHRKQKFLIELDYSNVKLLNKEKMQLRYEKFYTSKMDSLYKGILKNYSVQLADNLTSKDKSIIYEKIFSTLEDYIANILSIKLKIEDEEFYKEILDEYDRFDKYAVRKLDQNECIEKKAILLGISRQLFTHSLPLIVAEQCYINLLKETRNLIVDTRVIQKQKIAYILLIQLIEDYNIRLLSTKIYWDQPSDRDEYKKFWSRYKAIQQLKEDDEELYNKEKEILFIKNDLKKLNKSKTNYEKIVKFYKEKLVSMGAMKQIKNKCKTIGKFTKQKQIA